MAVIKTEKQKRVPPDIVELYLDEDPLHKAFDPQVTKRLLSYLKPYRWKFWFSLGLMLAGSLSNVLGPYLVKIALDDGIIGRSLPILGKTVLLYLFLIVMQWIVTYTRVNIMIHVGQSIIFNLRADLFDHLQRLSLSFFSRFSVGRVISRVMNDVSVLRMFITWALIATARSIFTLIGILVAMLLMDVRLTLLTFSVMPLMVIATILFQIKARERYRIVRAAISWVNSVLAENINGVRVVQAFSREEENYHHFKDTVNHHHLQSNLKAARVAALFFPTIDLLGMMATALVIWVGGVSVLSGEMSAGALVAFVIYITRFFEPIQDLSRRYDQFQSTMAGGERIFNLLNTPVEVKDSDEAIEMPVIKGHVVFKDVCFHYTDDHETVLTDLNLEVNSGQTVALVGETGAGKSTLVKLLSRFYDPTSGQVIIDGLDIRSITQNSLRSQMGIVLQDPFLFSGSVGENIRFGRVDATYDEVEAAAQAVGAHEFILQLREKYDTPVEEGGVLLSVGQRQLVSFARALLADPKILILDEATSSVDTQTELVIQSALAQLLQGRTSFVIAHRLSTITKADLIVVLHNGQIVETGTHAQLLRQEGRYFHLYTLGFEK